jgi:hypothetical protein
MDLPENVLTKGKAGKLEVRSVESRGRYVICKYLDPKTMKLADQKRKLMLRDKDGRVIEYFIIPLKDPNRALLISTKTAEKERQVWNEKLGSAEDVWAD